MLFLQIDAVASRLTTYGEPRAQVCVERRVWPASPEDIDRNRGVQDDGEDASLCSICLEGIDGGDLGTEVCDALHFRDRYEKTFSLLQTFFVIPHAIRIALLKLVNFSRQS